MSVLLNAILMIPLMILVRYMITDLSPFNIFTKRIASAVSWKPKDWHYSGKSLEDEHFIKLSKSIENHYTDFNETLESIMIPRIPGTEGHRRVRKYIEDTMTKLSWDMSIDEFTANTPHGNKPFANIIATLDPRACKRLVIACHYDSKVMPDGQFVGATDSAVPCAMMIHMAKLLNQFLDKHKESNSNTTLQFIFFDGEEAFDQWTDDDSIYGSRHLAQELNRMEFRKTQYQQTQCGHVNELDSELDRMEVMVLLDLLGMANPSFFSYFSNTNALYSRFIKIERKLNDLQQLESHPPQSRTNYFIERLAFGGIEDDHIPFLRRGVPIVHVIPSPFPSVWHTLMDNGDALHHPTINNLMKIFNVFIVQYLHLEV